MIKTTLPAIEKKLDENEKKVIVTEKQITVSIDTSIFAEERWESFFPENAKRETLFTYVERMRDSGMLKSKAHILSNLKALYCFMDGEDIADFKSFCHLFDLAGGEYLNRLVEKIEFVFNIVLESSTADSKN